MAASPRALRDPELERLVSLLLDEGEAIEIDGFGRFDRGADGRPVFIANDRPRVFIAYVDEDRGAALRLAENLSQAGIDPWIDRKRLMPGQNWPRAIEEAIGRSDFFVGCFSTRSVAKRGVFQSEIRLALECARRVPLDDAFMIPARLDACVLPRRIARETQWIDLFPEWDRGLTRIVEVIRSTRPRGRAST
jgi:hypothetical protein